MSTENSGSKSSEGINKIGNFKGKKFLPAIVLATTLYYSLALTSGIVLGYCASRVFCNLMGIDEHNGDKIFVALGQKWKIHVHHWILGIVVLAIVWVVDFFYLPTFFAGFVCGIILQDIYDYSDWHKVIIKNEGHTK